MSIYSSEIQTPIGSMLTCVNEEGVCLLEFSDRKDLNKQINKLKKKLGSEIVPGRNEHTELLEKQLSEYFSSKRKSFQLALVFTGSVFQEKVWNALKEVPFGKVSSYKKLTDQLGDPKAIRAVAGANGANKMAIIIPCHRVIGSNGSLIGYAGGLGRKQWLLDHESKQMTIEF